MRILLKISGESLKGKNDFGIDAIATKKVCETIKEIYDLGHELAIVIGGGNIYRGSKLIKEGLTSSDSHNLSMLSTIFNGIVLKDFLKKNGLEAIVMDSLNIKFLEKFNKDKAINYLKEGKIVIFVSGTGNPYFTTDTGGVLRALEINADLMVKATKVDGVYDKNPDKYPEAKLLSEINYDYVINNNLGVMDTTSIVLAKENNLIIKVVNFNKSGSIKNAINGKKEGTVIKG